MSLEAQMGEILQTVKGVAGRVEEIEAANDGTIPEAAMKQLESTVREMLDTSKEADYSRRKGEFDTDNAKAQDSNDMNFYRSREFRQAGGSQNEMSPEGLNDVVAKMLSNPTKDPVLRDIQSLNDEVMFLAAFKAASQKRTVEECVGELKSWRELDDSIGDFKKALGTDQTAGGAEFIPTGFSNQLVEELRLALRVADLHQTIDMPTDPFTVPTKIARSTAYLASEASVDGPTELRKSNLRTGNVTFASKTLAVATPFSFEFEEDSVVPVLPMVRKDIVLALADAIENSTINGDTASTHLDTGITMTSDDQRKSWDGYRKLANSAAKIDFNSGSEAFTTTNFRNIRKGMGKYGVNPADLAYVVSINAYIRMLGLAEVLTLDKYGPSTPILTGELARFDGIPVIVSEHVRTDLNASAVMDGITTTKSEVILVHKPSFWYGNRGSSEVEVVRNPITRQFVVVTAIRRDMQKVYPSADNSVGIGYDFAS